jgi:hypothetical protein
MQSVASARLRKRGHTITFNKRFIESLPSPDSHAPAEVHNILVASHRQVNGANPDGGATDEKGRFPSGDRPFPDKKWGGALD